jgi:Holliday junction resolvase RusA-like endonuclease
MVPVEFIVVGTPVSQQTKNRTHLAAWRAAVAAEAQTAMPPGANPTPDNVEVQVVYYYETGPALLDVDNLVKPIQDAMNGVVYVDDAQVTDCTSSKRDINGRFEVRHMRLALALGFVQGGEFVYVSVRDAPDPTRLRT